MLNSSRCAYVTAAIDARGWLRCERRVQLYMLVACDMIFQELFCPVPPPKSCTLLHWLLCTLSLAFANCSVSKPHNHVRLGMPTMP